MSSVSPSNGAESPILLVEDNANDEALTLRALGKAELAGHVTVVRDGAEALDYLFATGSYSDRDVAQLPRVVFLDLKLPKVDGLEVLRRVREHERTRLLPVVIFTSSDEERDQLESYRLGANSYVRKPVKSDDFSAVVQQLGRYWLDANSSPPAPAGPRT